MIKNKRIFSLVLVFLLGLMSIINTAFAETNLIESEEIMVSVDGNNVEVYGNLNEVNEDITIIVYRSSDNAKSYIDQGKTNENGEYSFEFSLSNGTYKAVVSSSKDKYISEDILVYKTPGQDEEPGEINVDVNDNNVCISVKLNETNENITLIVYRNSDDAKVYIDQKTTDENGESSFDFNLPNGTYYAVVTSSKEQFIIENIIVDYNIGGSDGGDSRPKTLEVSIIIPTDIVGHWAEENIVKLIKLGAVASYPDGLFRPDKNITRAEFATVLVKAFALVPKTESVFSDTANHWAKDFITAATDNKIILGYGNNLFGPDDLITREQMAVMIAKAMKLNPEESETLFIDNDEISEWAKKYVAAAAKAKLVSGYLDGTYRPADNAKRAEAVTVIVNGLDNISN